MLPLIDVLFNYTAEHWHTATALLSETENRDYEDAVRRTEEQAEKLEAILSEEQEQHFHRYVENCDTTANVESMLHFSRGIAIGLQLASLAME